MAKVRMSKRRVTTAAELQAWSMVFETGGDYLGDLEVFGVKIEATRRWRDKTYPAMEHSNADEVRDAAAGEAWYRLGAVYMAQRDDAAHGHGVPWALERFGDPRHG
jgi:hypothetical protein